MVTRKGYQESAIKTARASGIYLKKFQLPDDMNLNGKTRNILISIHVLTIENLQRNFIPDKKWLSKNAQLSAQFYAPTNEIFLVDDDGNFIESLWELENSLPRGEHSATALKYSFLMQGKVFLQTPYSQAFPLDRIDYQYDVLDTVEELSLSANDVLQGLLYDMDGQESFLFFLDNSFLKAAAPSDASL